MAGRTNWKTMRAKRDEEPGIKKRRAAARKRLRDDIDDFEHGLFELRRAQSMTQGQLSQALGVTQGQVSRLEHQTDLYLSTLNSYVEAMGGELELTARFGDRRVGFSVGDLVPREPA